VPDQPPDVEQPATGLDEVAPEPARIRLVPNRVV
jgi:hypothetical protein